MLEVALRRLPKLDKPSGKRPQVLGNLLVHAQIGPGRGNFRVRILVAQDPRHRGIHVGAGEVPQPSGEERSGQRLERDPRGVPLLIYRFKEGIIEAQRNLPVIRLSRHRELDSTTSGPS